MSDATTDIKIKKAFVPGLRFKGFEGEWTSFVLKDITPTNEKYGIVDGPFGSNLKTIHYKEEGVPIITSGYVTNGYFFANKYLFVTPKKFLKEKRSAVRAGDIVMAKIGARCGASAILPEDHVTSILSGNALKITVDESRFSTIIVWQQLSYLYSTHKIDLLKTVGAQPAISIANLKKFKIVVPSLPEQQKIASFLSVVDKKIYQLTKKKELLEQYKIGVMQHLFSGQLRFKDENGNEYPEWEGTSVLDIADKKVKWSFTGGPFGSDLKSDDYTETGIRVIQLQNIGDGLFHDNSKIYTSVQKADQLLACNIYAGEMILSKMGDPVARACIIPDSNQRWLMCSDGIRYVIDETRFSKNYLFNYINSSFFRKKALSLSTGSTRKRIGLGDLKKVKISHPNFKEQEKIGMLLSSLGKNIERVNNQITQNQTFKKGLLQQMFI